jgi:hypothetical protein
MKSINEDLDGRIHDHQLMSILRTILLVGWFAEIAYTLFIENLILYE